MRKVDAPETAAIIADAKHQLPGLTEQEAAAFERDLSKIARRYGRAREMVKLYKRKLAEWERDLKDARREMRMLISARRK